ncbi:hypothetical protein GW17_00052964 [Ensete ventricosum]|nr:hypothetical protein GW17_00052964 [Ensete ventricosum]
MDTRWLITDFVVSALGLKDLLPPYNAADSLDLSDIATGISFASAGSGLDDLTAEQSQVMTMAQELSNFAAYTERLTAALGKKAQDIIGGPLFVIGAGSNDWMMNYYMSPIRSGTYSKVEYSRLLIGKLRSVVEVLHCFLSRAFHAHAHAHAKEFHSNMIDAGERWLEVCHLRASTAGLSSSADHSEGNGVHRPYATTKLRGGAEQRRRRQLPAPTLRRRSESFARPRLVRVHTVRNPSFAPRDRTSSLSSLLIRCHRFLVDDVGLLRDWDGGGGSVVQCADAGVLGSFFLHVLGLRHPSEATYIALAEQMIQEVLPKFG